MLSFVDSLKQIIADVQATGGTVLERGTPSPNSLQKLREYAIQRIAETKPHHLILIEWFTEGFFDAYARACAIHLCKLGITNEDSVYRIITKVIDAELTSAPYHFQRERKDFEEQVAFSLLDIWEQMGDEQTIAYTFAQERWLIAWDYQQSRWKATGLGQLLLELSPVQAATFLLSIDTLFSTGKHDFRHVGAEVLRELVHPQPDSDEPFHMLPLHRDILAQLGLLRERDNRRPDRVEMTSIGRAVLHRVLDKDNPFREAAARLMETEELGDTFKGSVAEMNEVEVLAGKSELIDKANRESITTSTDLYRAGKYLDSLKVLYPSIEHVINNMVQRAGEQIEHFKGLVDKARWLEQHRLIPPDVSSAVEVFTSRNRVLHGNFSPPEDYVFPLCLLAFRYLRRLLAEYHPVPAID